VCGGGWKKGKIVFVDDDVKVKAGHVSEEEIRRRRRCCVVLHLCGVPLFRCRGFSFLLVSWPCPACVAMRVRREDW